jgi:hypothetical protein
MKSVLIRPNFEFSRNIKNKYTYDLISPDNVKYNNIIDLVFFCKEHKLDYKKLSVALSHKQTHHYMWTVFRKIREKIKIKEKICHKCGKKKSIKKFYPNGSNIDGYRNNCKTCVDKQNKNYTLSDKYIREEKSKDYRYRTKYGITYKKKKEIILNQDNKCLCCGIDFKTLKLERHICIDHDHLTGKVRGVLCTECNIALGLLHEDLNRVKSLENYIINNCTKKLEVLCS